jgi:hypothetical protein
MYAAAGEPKRLLELEGTSHYGLYVERFQEIADAASEWYAQHLRPPEMQIPALRGTGFWG